MPSMSYCRHQNTYKELLECARDLEERMSGAEHDDEDEGGIEPMSADERAARADLFGLMAQMFEQIGFEIDQCQVAEALETLA